MGEIERLGSGGPYEGTVGYSRVVRAGPLVAVSGCTALGPDGEVIGGGDMLAQARAACAAVVDALGAAGASTAQVIRTRIHLTDMTRWQDAARAHAEAFGAAPPASTMVEVSALIDPRLLVEIDATAWIAG
jgi:enamine deaminase RidA (YjgF/YER057c/UK114 family)